jgi:hypothetical protein
VLHDYLIALQRKIDERIANLSSDLANGCAKDHADYKRIVGGIAEAGHVKLMAHDLLIRFMNEDDDD